MFLHTTWKVSGGSQPSQLTNRKRCLRNTWKVSGGSQPAQPEVQLGRGEEGDLQPAEERRPRQQQPAGQPQPAAQGHLVHREGERLRRPVGQLDGGHGVAVTCKYIDDSRLISRDHFSEDIVEDES
jgi:hypothetical protein